MPKIRRQGVPRVVLDHLRTRMREREISTEQLVLLARWLDTEPEVPAGLRFKRFPGMIACREGKLVKIFLRLGQAPSGEEIH